MRDNKIRDFEHFVGCVPKYFKIYTIASSDNKNDIFTFVFCVLEYFRKLSGAHGFSSFIKENYLSFRLFHCFNDAQGFFYFDIFRIGMGNGF